MTTIKAIETRYRGYRFRSRLEARWAVFFDQLGLKWDYEQQGFDLGQPLGAYLPDFWLPELKKWIEIKPESGAVEPQRLYLAGKITGDPWRGQIVDNDRVHAAENLLVDGFASLEFAIHGTPHTYVGPFKLGLDKHGCSVLSGDWDQPEESHGLESGNTGANSHDYPNRGVIFRNCMEAIDDATVVFAWVNSTDCYATFAEIGYAMRARKLVRIGFDERLSSAVVDDMWFLSCCASGEGSYPSAAAAFDALVGRCDSWLTDDIRKANALTKLSRHSCEIVYGDPLSHYERRNTPWLNGHPSAKWHDAMIAARSARFEHGETPGGRP